MSGLGGLNKTPDGVVIGLVQLQLPTIVNKGDLAAQTKKICAMVQKARKAMATMDLVVFPEYSLHGLSMDTNAELMSRLDGPEVASFRKACAENRIWGCFSIMEYNPDGNPYNSGIIIDERGEVKLYYRKMHPWVPVEPWEPGNLGIPVCDGPNGSKVALIICHDGMFPEMARECAYKGANIMLRTAGYTAPIRNAWHVSNQSNAFTNLMYTANVCMAGTDGVFNSMGEGMIVNFDGVPLVTGNGVPDEIITAEVRPKLADEARRIWGVENNIYQFGHRGFVAVKGGAQDCPYTYMRDLMAGQYRLPWEDEVQVTELRFPDPQSELWHVAACNKALLAGNRLHRIGGADDVEVEQRSARARKIDLHSQTLCGDDIGDRVFIAEFRQQHRVSAVSADNFQLVITNGAVIKAVPGRDRLSVLRPRQRGEQDHQLRMRGPGRGPACARDNQ